MAPQDGGNMTEQTPAWRRVLVTGGSGFTGINLVRYLLSKGVKVRSLDLAEWFCKASATISKGLADHHEKISKKTLTRQAQKGLLKMAICAFGDAILPFFLI